MATDPKHTKALDQLQREISLILQHTGQMFASSTKEHGVPVAHALRLKGEVPDSMARFNDALDVLESDIQMAQAVMRRDLAVCLEKADQKPQAIENGPSQPESSKHEDPAKGNSISTGNEDSDKVNAMTIDPPGPPQGALPATTAERPITPAVAQPHSEESPDPLAGLEHALGATRAQQSSKQDQLHVDTKPAGDPQTQDQPPSQEQPDPNTALTHANTDLDSLFGGPMSATTTTGPSNPFSPDAKREIQADTQGPSQISGPDNGSGNMNADFDFDFTSDGGFNANNNSNNPSNSNSNDALSALIPGLQEYANEPSSQPQNPNTTMNGMDPTVSAPSDLDFNNLFGDIANGSGGDGGDLDMDMGAGGSFDELMDFAEFDTANFGGGNAGDGGNNDGEDLNFDFNFD